MSRLAKKPIAIPTGVTATIDDGKITVKGPKGEVARDLNRRIKIEALDNGLKVEAVRRDDRTRALVGTYAAHLKNMMKGATVGFEKKLIVEGVGYRAAAAGDKLTLSLGYSHPVILAVPAGLKVAVEKELITVQGADIEQVGQFAALVRSWRPPNPYKEKGVRYENEFVRRKQGKKAVT